MAMATAGQFEVVGPSGRDRLYHVRERARNGEITMSSERYTRKDSAHKAAAKRASEKRGRWPVVERSR